MKKSTQIAIGIATTILAVIVFALCALGSHLYYIDIAINKNHEMAGKMNADLIREESIWISEDGNFYLVNECVDGENVASVCIKKKDGSFAVYPISVSTGASITGYIDSKERTKAFSLKAKSVESDTWELIIKERTETFNEMNFDLAKNIKITRYDYAEKADLLSFRKSK